MFGEWTDIRDAPNCHDVSRRFESAVCDQWNLLDVQPGEVLLEVEIDWTGDIDETNEVNNVWSGTIVVNPTQSDAGETATKMVPSVLTVRIYGSEL